MAAINKGKIIITRCLEEDIPTLLDGEMCYTTDTDKLYIGNKESGNMVIMTHYKTSDLVNDSNFISSNDEIDADKINGKTISEPMTKQEYDAIVDKDPNTIYLVDDDTTVEGVPSYTATDASKLLAVNSNGTALAWVDVPSGGSVLNSLDNYSGSTLNDKMVALFNDINNNYKNTPMVITLPSGVIEITTDLVANGWTNKVFIANSYLYYNNCNAIEFIQCTHNNIYIHASSSSNLDIASGNIIGLITPSNVSSLTKRGYKITDCSYNEFKFNSIIGFTNAIEIYSEYGAKGCFYNNIYFTAIWRCQRPMIFRTGKAVDDTSSQSGWITEIYTHGGMFDCDDGILIGQELDDRPSGEPNDNYQGLKFYNIGVEHVRKQADGRGFYFLQGKNNAIINPRFEGSMGSGNSTSGAYILVEESGYSWNNRIETSNYPLTVTRVKLNYNAKQLVNTTYDNPAGSYIEGDLYHSKEVDGNLLDFKLGYKATATPGKMIYEAKNLSNYYLNEAPANTFNYTFSDTEYAKIKISDGTIKTIGYTS